MTVSITAHLLPCAHLGEWNNGLLMNTSEPLVFASGTHTFPQSQCSQECKYNQIKRMQQVISLHPVQMYGNIFSDCPIFD